MSFHELADHIVKIAGTCGTVRVFDGTMYAQFLVSKNTILHDLFEIVAWLGSLPEGSVLNWYHGPSIDFAFRDGIHANQKEFCRRVGTKQEIWFSDRSTEASLFFEVKLP